MARNGNKPDLSGLRVLLVDDHRDSADSLAWLLQSFGCEAQARFDGVAALDCVEALKPHVIFLDIRLPDMPGTEVCRRLRALEALAGTMIVALTGATDDATLEAVDKAGFDRTLTKPVELGEVLDVLSGASWR